MTENEKAIYCYEQALKHNYGSHEALSKLGSLFLQLEHYSKVISLLSLLYFDQTVIDTLKSPLPSLGTSALISYPSPIILKAIEYLGRALEIVKTGELFRDIGICYMMMNDLQRAFSFYQNALFQLPQVSDHHRYCSILPHYSPLDLPNHCDCIFRSDKTPTGLCALVQHRYSL